MEKTAFVFPGQGSQCPGMGRSLYEGSARVRALFDEGSAVLGRSLPDLLFNTDTDTLSETAFSQPAIFAVSLAAAALLAEGGLKADAVCGFSLGEVGALTHAGVFTPAAGFEVIAKRAACMQEAADSSAGGMCAVIGLPAETVEDICRETEGYVIPVNYNCPKQVVIAGEERALAAAAAKCTERKALKVVRLKVNAAFHSALMKDAAKKLAAETAHIPSSPAGIPVYSCADRAVMRDFSDMPGYMQRQMISPVRFEDVIRLMIADGFTTFVEVGAGTVLSGLIKRISREVTILSAGDMESVKQCLAR